MNSRRSFLASLLALPAAVKAAVSKVGQKPLVRKGDNISVQLKARQHGYTSPWQAIESNQKFVRQLWLDCDTDLAVSVNGAPFKEVKYNPMHRMVIDLPPWEQKQTQTITIKPVEKDTEWKIYNWNYHHENQSA